MKNRMILALVFVSSVALPAIADFVIETKDGTKHLTKTVEVADGKTVNGIDVAEIQSITHEPAVSGPTNFNDNNKNRVAILDMNFRNGDKEDGTNDQLSRSLYSAQYMAMLAGIPSFTTADINEAMEKASMILLSSRIVSKSFTPDEISSLKNWVSDGGVLVASAIHTANKGSLYELFGISAQSTGKDKGKYELTWVDGDYPELRYFDTPEEKTVVTEELTASAYTTTTAETLARFNGGASAVIKNKIGKGVAYSVGLRWRDVIQRFHLNKDGEIQRKSSNAFEPSGDVYPLFLRSVFAANNPVSVWKYTVPDGQETVLIPTHDCDSRTAYDEMYWMSDYEKSMGLRSHFFMTVHYYRDAPYMSAFYNEETIPKVKELLAAGHTVGSHSIGHYPDFSSTDLFPMDIVTEDEYANRAHRGNLDTTEGGSTWAEVVLSKKILERDLGTKVRSFRSGHLCVNKNMPQAKVDGGYNFTSCYSACDLLSNYPFYVRIGNDWQGDLTNVLQMPLHISDVFKGRTLEESDMPEIVDTWVPVFEKLKGNNAACILLIHPNREWKMKVEKMFVDRMNIQPQELYNFEDYGDFWVNRAAFDFSYDYDASTGGLKIKANRADIKANSHLGLMLDNTLPVTSVVLIDENGENIPISIKRNKDNKIIIML